MNSVFQKAFINGVATGVPAGTAHYVIGPNGIAFGSTVGIALLPQLQPFVAAVANRFLSSDYLENTAVKQMTASTCEGLANCLAHPRFEFLSITALGDLLKIYVSSPSPAHFRVIAYAGVEHTRHKIGPALLTALIVFAGTAVGTLAGPLGTIAGTGAGSLLAYKVATLGDPVMLVMNLLQRFSDEERAQFATVLRSISARIREAR